MITHPLRAGSFNFTCSGSSFDEHRQASEMNNVPSLPSSNFRLAALAVLASITVGFTVIEIEGSMDAASSPTMDTSGDEGVASAEPSPDTSTEPATTIPTGDAVDKEASDSELFVKSNEDSRSSSEAPETVWRTDDFSSDGDNWSPLAGNWEIANGQYIQGDSAGFDLLTQFNDMPPDEFEVSVEMTAVDSDLGGGIMIGQPEFGSRRGSTLIDFTDAGRFLRWGRYDESTGKHEYLGGLAVDADFDPAATHQLTVRVTTDRTLISLDGRPFGDFDAVGPGHLGLGSSTSSVAFDNLEIVELS